MMRIVERAGSALSLYVVIFGIFAMALGVTPLAQSNLWAIDVEGTYTGTAKCTRYNADGTMMRTDRALTVDITQGNEVEGVSDLNIRIQLDDEISFLDGVSRDDAKKPGKKGTVTGVLCENSPNSSADNAVINGLVRRAHKPLKTKIKKGFANITGEDFNETCKWKVKRIDVDDPEIPDCPDGPDTSDTAPDGTGTGPDGTGTGPDGTGTATDGTGTATDGTGTATDGTGTGPDGTGTATDGTGTATDGTGTGPDGTGTATDGTGTATDGTGTDGTDTGGLDPVMGECASDPFECPTVQGGTGPIEWLPWCVMVDGEAVTTCCIAGTVPKEVTSNPRFAACLSPELPPF